MSARNRNTFTRMDAISVINSVFHTLGTNTNVEIQLFTETQFRELMYVVLASSEVAALAAKVDLPIDEMEPGTEALSNLVNSAATAISKGQSVLAEGIDIEGVFMPFDLWLADERFTNAINIPLGTFESTRQANEKLEQYLRAKGVDVDLLLGGETQLKQLPPLECMTDPQYPHNAQLKILADNLDKATSLIKQHDPRIKVNKDGVRVPYLYKPFDDKVLFSHLYSRSIGERGAVDIGYRDTFEQLLVMLSAENYMDPNRNLVKYGFHLDEVHGVIVFTKQGHWLAVAQKAHDIADVATVLYTTHLPDIDGDPVKDLVLVGSPEIATLFGGNSAMAWVLPLIHDLILTPLPLGRMADMIDEAIASHRRPERHQQQWIDMATKLEPAMAHYGSMKSL